MPSSARVTVVIPSWKGAHLLRRTLPTVLAQRGVNFSVLVVENGICDDTGPLVESFRDEKLRLLKIVQNQGYAAGVNAGVAAAQTDLVAVLCNDNEVPPDWLAELLSAFDKGENSGAVMSRTEVPGLDVSRRGTMNFCGRNILFSDDRLPVEPLPIFYPGGNAFLFSKKILPQPFDPDYFTYQEDVYCGWRLRNLGYEVFYWHGSVARSFDGGTTKRMPFRTAFLTERNRCLNLLTFPETRTAAVLAPLWILDGLAALALKPRRFARFSAWLWLLTHPGFVLEKRAQLQRERRAPDTVSLRAMGADYLPEDGRFRAAKRLVNQLLSVYFRGMGVPLDPDFTSPRAPRAY